MSYNTCESMDRCRVGRYHNQLCRDQLEDDFPVSIRRWGCYFNLYNKYHPRYTGPTYVEVYYYQWYHCNSSSSKKRTWADSLSWEVLAGKLTSWKVLIWWLEKGFVFLESGEHLDYKLLSYFMIGQSWLVSCQLIQDNRIIGTRT